MSELMVAFALAIYAFIVGTVCGFVIGYMAGVISND